MTVTLYDLHAAVLAHLRQPSAFGTDGVHDGAVVDPAVDAAGRIQPYAVVWLAPGVDPEAPLAGPAGGEDRLHVTVAAMDPARTAWAVDRARTALDRAVLSVAGVPVETRWLAGYVPPPIGKDEDISPVRWFCPLIFSAAAG